MNGFLSVVQGVSAERWRAPGLGAWSVQDLVGHTSRALLTVEAYLDPTLTTTEPAVLDAVGYFQAAAAALSDPNAVAQRGRDAGQALGSHPAAAVGSTAERVLALVDGSPDDALVRTPVGTMTLLGYLPSRTFEFVVHSLDLVAATALDVPPQLHDPMPACLQLAAQLAADQGHATDVLRALTGRHSLTDGFSVI